MPRVQESHTTASSGPALSDLGPPRSKGVRAGRFGDEKTTQNINVWLVEAARTQVFCILPEPPRPLLTPVRHKAPSLFELCNEQSRAPPVCRRDTKTSRGWDRHCQ